jgi:hypothetical protein
VRWAVALVAIAAAGTFAYDVGLRQNSHRVTELRAQVDDLFLRLQALQQRNTELQASVIVIEERMRGAQQQSQDDVQSGPLADLLARIREKLKAGVEIERLKFLVDAAANTSSCDEASATKRFMVRTPLSAGANDSVGFADGAITVTARGVSMINAQGKTEAWFDPGQPITLSFARLGGSAMEVSGTLPLHAAVVVGDSEHRFSAVRGPQGFVQITGARCRLS